MVKGIVFESIGEDLMIFCATLTALNGCFLALGFVFPIFIYEIIAGLCLFGIGGFLKLYGVKKSKEEKKWKLKKN